MFRDRTQQQEPIRMVLDDETVDRLRIAAARYGMDVEAMMVAVLQAGAARIDDLLGDPPTHTRIH